MVREANKGNNPSQRMLKIRIRTRIRILKINVPDPLVLNTQRDYVQLENQNADTALKWPIGQKLANQIQAKESAKLTFLSIMKKTSSSGKSPN